MNWKENAFKILLKTKDSIKKQTCISTIVQVLLLKHKSNDLQYGLSLFSCGLCSMRMGAHSAGQAQNREETAVGGAHVLKVAPLPRVQWDSCDV